MSSDSSASRLRFETAAEMWRQDRKPYLKPRSWDMYRQYIKFLNRFFGDMPLREIHIGNIREYQRMRSTGEIGRKAGPSCINHELNTLAQILDRAGIWEGIKRHYEPLPLPSWRPPKVLTHAQEDHFFKIAASNPNWAVAYWVTSITNNTSASGAEVRHLQLRHVLLDSDPPKIHIPDGSVKNEYRARVIPLNDVALKQVARALNRAKELGAYQADDYLFPFRISTGNYDVTRPASASFIKTAFNEARAAADLPWLTPHCLRHQVITKLLEGGTAEQTVMAIAGHVSRKMMEHYSHIRVSAKHDALQAISPSNGKPPLSVIGGKRSRNRA